MYRIGVIPLALVMCGFGSCQTRPVVPPKVVEVVVEKIVPVPPALTAPCQDIPKQNNSTGEAVRLANARKAATDECSGRMEKIRGLVK